MENKIQVTLHHTFRFWVADRCMQLTKSKKYRPGTVKEQPMLRVWAVHVVFTVVCCLTLSTVYSHGFANVRSFAMIISSIVGTVWRTVLVAKT